MSNVDHPKHYGGRDNPYEAIKVIEAWRLGFHLGSVLKYIARAGRKPNADSVEDLQKAAWYLQRQIENATGAPRRPTIVCLCGSTKFKEQFIKANFDLTMEGKVVLSVGWFSHADGAVYTPTADEKRALDELHKQKIDLADEVFVLNVGGYVGESTRSEIEHAEKTGKPVRYFEALDESQFVPLLR